MVCHFETILLKTFVFTVAEFSKIAMKTHIFTYVKTYILGWGHSFVIKAEKCRMVQNVFAFEITFVVNIQKHHLQTSLLVGFSDNYLD